MPRSSCTGWGPRANAAYDAVSEASSGEVCYHRAEANRRPTMTTDTVGLRVNTRSRVFTIEAEGALVAALKSKLENPDAAIPYVRKANRRGDRRHPHDGLRASHANSVRGT